MIVGCVKEMQTNFNLIQIDECAMYFELKLNNMTYIIIFSYISPNLLINRNVEELFNKWYDVSHSNQNIILMADMNGRIGDFDLYKEKRNAKDAQINSGGKKIIDEISRLGLKIANGNYNGDINGEFTFHHNNNKGKSTVDLCLFTEQCDDTIMDFKIEDCTHSDHFPISLTLTHQTEIGTEKAQVNKKTKFNYKDKNADVVNYTKELDVLTKNIETENKDNDINTIDYELKQAIQTAAKSNKILQIKSSNMSKKARFGPKWFDTECREAKKYKNWALRRMKRGLDTEEEYKEANYSYKSICSIKQVREKRITIAILNNHKTSGEFWEAMRILKRRKSRPNPIDIQSWTKHYSNLFEESDAHETLNEEQSCVRVSSIDTSEFNEPITEEEVRENINKLKKNKAPGHDMLPNETWKYASPQLILILLSLFQRCYDQAQVPLNWCKVIISPIYKKGDRDQPTNYRPIALVPTILKL
jgi:Endonuclease-reverse transcriptase